MGTFFVLPVYLQVVLGFDAFETGKRLFPMSIAMLAALSLGAVLSFAFDRRLLGADVACQKESKHCHANQCRRVDGKRA